MFQSQTRLFSKIVCPSVELKVRCETLNCVFLHPEDEAKKKEIQSSFNKGEYLDRYQSYISPNTIDKHRRSSLGAHKRRSSGSSSTSTATTSTDPLGHRDPPSQAVTRTSMSGPPIANIMEDKSSENPQVVPPKDETVILDGIDINPSTRPSKKQRKNSGNPSLPKIPAAGHRNQEFAGTRKTKGTGLHAMNKNNKAIKQPRPPKEYHEDISLAPKPVLPFPPAQIETRMRYLALLQHLFHQLGLRFPNRESVDREYEIALKTSNRTYELVIKREIYQMANPRLQPLEIEDPELHKLQQLNKQMESLKSLVSHRRKLAQNGYITRVPRLPDDFTPPERMKCDRCGYSVEVFKIATRSKCVYHPERFFLSRKTAGSFASNDINSKYYPCCNQPVGENEGCEISQHHVFKRNSPEELHHDYPFVSTLLFPKNSDTLKAIALDCEMGYTTVGFELIRATLVDFFSEQVVYDEIIKPEGKIIDLNTYWSGVSEIDETKAPNFNTFQRQMSRFIDKDTILIGHSLENDLNVMRLVHHQVVDTSIMFTNGMRKRSLKDITFQFLSKKIQGGEHDSEEDARSCIELVKWQIEELNKNK